MNLETNSKNKTEKYTESVSIKEGNKSSFVKFSLTSSINEAL